MLHTAFDWLEGYKDQLGLLIQALLFIATIVLIRVGWKQAIAADAQAKAAAAQVAAANEQANTAKTQLDMSIKEMFANLSAADAATRPLLHIFPDLDYRGPDDLICHIESCGLGPALEVQAFYGKNPTDAAGMYGNSLAIGEKRSETFDLVRVQNEDLTIHYKSTHGSTYSTSLSYMKGFDEYFELHTRVKNAFEEMADLTFSSPPAST
jgi:hypothetical protein